MDLSIAVDVKRALADIRDLREDQIPFALAKSLSATTLGVQQLERARMHTTFDVRQPQWMERSVKITHFPTKKEPWAVIGIHPPGASGDRKADIVGKFETDSEKRPAEGRTIAVPIGARRNKKDIIQRGQRPKAFNFRQVGQSVRGDKRTFIVRLKSTGAGLILQRVGRGARSEVRALYMLLPRVEITPNLRFIPVAEQVVHMRWADDFAKAMADAMRTAR